MSDREEGLELVCGDARARIACRGAELRAWRAGGLDLLWSPKAEIWPAVSPILFPIVGRLVGDQWRIGTRTTRMGVHGFAAQTPFRLDRLDESSARGILSDTPQSRTLYPFGFRLTVDYRLHANALAIALTVENRGETPMPYACGLHPGFRWPFDGGEPRDYEIAFDRSERAQVPEITIEGLFGRGLRRTPIRRAELPLSPDLFAREALCFLDAASSSLRFLAPSGRAIRIAVEDFPHWALWSRPPGAFLCIESWTGHGDPADFKGELFEKPSMCVLDPGSQGRHAATFTFE